MKRKSRGEQMLAALGHVMPSPGPADSPTRCGAGGRGRSAETSPEARRPPAKQPRTLAASSREARSDIVAHDAASSASQELPADLQLLGGMFEALQAGRMLLKRRGEKVTYTTVRHIVENTTRREFRVEHLAQMKHLRPESFDWQYIYAPSAANPKKLEQQLLLAFDRAAPCDSAGGGSAPRYNSANEQADFRSKLQQYWLEHRADAEAGGVLPKVPQAVLPPKGSTPLPGSGGSHTTPFRSASLPQALGSPSKASPSCQLRAATSCEAGALPGVTRGLLMSPTRSSARPPGAAGASPLLARAGMDLMARQASNSNLTPTPTRHRPCPSRQDNGGGEQGGAEQQARAPPLELSEHGSQQQHTASGGSGFMQRLGSLPAPGQATPQSKARQPPASALQGQSTPTQQQQDPRIARLHSMLSPAALKKIQEAEEAQEAQTPEARRRADMRGAVQMMPQAFDHVRAIFGAQGAVVRPFGEVARLMCERTTARAGLNAREAANALAALARAVPEYLRIEEPRVMADGSQRAKSVAISRTVSITAVAARLRGLAANGDAAVETLFLRPAGTAAAPPPPQPGGGRDGALAGAAAAAQEAGASALDAHAGAGCQLKQQPSLDALQPLNLLEACLMKVEEAGGAAPGAGGPAPPFLPQAPPSAKKRPPGLPLPPASPLPRRAAAATPSKRAPLADSCSQAAEGLMSPPRLPRDTPSASQSSRFGTTAAADGGTTTGGMPFLMRPAPSTPSRSALQGLAAPAAAGAPCGTPTRTPGRTAVQEETLRSSIRRRQLRLEDGPAPATHDGGGGAARANAGSGPAGPGGTGGGAAAGKRLEGLL